MSFQNNCIQLIFQQMSVKKSREQIFEEAEDQSVEIEIVTVGVGVTVRPIVTGVGVRPEQIIVIEKEEPQENVNSIQSSPNNQSLPIPQNVQVPQKIDALLNISVPESIAVPQNIDNQVVSKQSEVKIEVKIVDVNEQEKFEENGESMIKNQKLPFEKQGPNQSQQQDEQNEQSNISEQSKSQKKQKNDESNSERKQELPTSRKCFNKLCTSKKIYKKIRSRVEDNKYRFFCKNCYENYYNNLYCEFCQQIYSNNCENEDDDKWIGCDTCERWNHIECQKKFRDKNINDLKDKNLLYECLVCCQRSKNNQTKNNKGEKQVGEDKVILKQKIQINKDQRVLIFHKKYQSFPNLEYFLQNYSFRLWMNEAQIRQDLEYLRNNCMKAPQEEIGKGKLKKVKNND